MGRETIQTAFLLLLHLAFCFALPSHHQQYRKLPGTDPNEGLILGEGIASAQLNIQPTLKKPDSDDDTQPIIAKNNILTQFNNPTVVNGKSENDPVDFGNEDYIAELSGVSTENNLKNNLVRKANRASLKLPQAPITVASANPIYITIPIYLNKAEGQPLRLSVAGQEIPLSPKATNRDTNVQSASPTSQFNRLLQQNVVETVKPQRKATRKSNRKRKRHHSNNVRAAPLPESFYPQLRNSIDTNRVPDQLVSYRFYF